MKPSTTTFVPNPDHAKKLKADKDERDCQLAKEILALAVQASLNKTAEEVTATAETFWKWVNSD